MARIALVNIGMHGHVNPTLGLAEELVRRGHEVFFLSTPEFEASIKKTGATFLSYPSVIGTRIAETAKIQALATLAENAPPESASMMQKFGEEFQVTLAPLWEALKKVKPELIINDFASLAGKIIAETLNVPLVKFFTTYASNQHYNLLKESFAKYDFPSLEVFAAFQAQIDEACSNLGLNSINLMKSMTEIEDHNLVFMPKHFQPLHETFDGRFKFVGPSFQKRPLGEHIKLLSKSPEDAPLLLISLGSLFHEWPEFFRDAIKAFGNTSWQVVMGIGSRLKVEDLGEIPSNFTVTPHVPQVELLEIASLFISHGGMNSTMESLAFGVPLVVIPQIEEQEITAKRVHNMKLGRYVPRKDVTAQTLLKAVQEVAQSAEIAGNVSHMQRQIDAAGGPIAAANYVEAVLTGDLTANHDINSLAKFV